MRDNPHACEEHLVRSFIVTRKQERYLTKLRSKKARGPFVAEHLYHMVDLDDRYTRRLSDSEALAVEAHGSTASRAEGVAAVLYALGAGPLCYVVSTNAALDGRVLGLRDTLEAVVGSGEGSLIMCEADHLGYYEGERDNDRLILQRRC